MLGDSEIDVSAQLRDLNTFQPNNFQPNNFSGCKTYDFCD